MIPRHLTPSLLAALGDTPIVALVGARQTGKTTLVQWIGDSQWDGRYVTFDDPAMLAAAEADPDAFVAGLKSRTILDEVQRAPKILPSLKLSVDRDRRPGRFLLTGSADVLVLPELSKALVGRMEILTLWPLSQGEIEGELDLFVDRIFADSSRFEDRPAVGDTLGRALRGGYPEPLGRAARRRDPWFDSYVTTILQRDIRDLAAIEGLATLPHLLEVLAHRVGSPINYADISRTIGLPQTTLKRYIALLEHTFLVHTIPAWAKQPSRRLAKSPKLIFADTGLLARAAGWTRKGMQESRRTAGPLLENFVLMELRKQLGWSRRSRRLFHFRTSGGHEVDAVVEDHSGRLVGVEVKSSGTLGSKDFRGLKKLQEVTGDAFHRGIVLYEGERRLPFGPNMDAVPLSTLWSETPGSANPAQ